MSLDRGALQCRPRFVSIFRRTIRIMTPVDFYWSLDLLTTWEGRPFPKAREQETREERRKDSPNADPTT
jgi:hypothetical protein